MKEEARLRRNADRLLQLHPGFRQPLAAVIQELESAGFRPRIQDAWRSPQDQLVAFQTGHSRLKFGFHNVTGPNGEPESLAVDLLDDDAPLNPSKAYLLQLAAIAEANGLSTGIRWGLPEGLRNGIDAAIAAGNWDAPVKVGWDPMHVEVSGITVADARGGARPTFA